VEELAVVINTLGFPPCTIKYDQVDS